MVRSPGRFVWFELITTDVAGAKAFYSDVVGWGAQDASTPAFDYAFFTSEGVPVGGLMDLPEDARKMGATPRWMGYVEVDDVDAAVARIKRLGGAVYVPPTDSNIGRISVVADPQTTTLGLIKGLKPGPRRSPDRDKPGRVGWHELLATDWEKAFTFYGELFGWQKAGTENEPIYTYQLFSTGGQTIGGMFTKRPEDPLPFWLFYFNVADIDAALERVTAGGGQVFRGPLELPSGSLIARCRDPQGGAFALQGSRNQAGFGWITEWGGISSRGRLVTKPRG